MPVDKKRAAKPKADVVKDRAIGFKAPNEIHGVLKTIVGRLEISRTKIGGRVQYERDILTWLVSELWMEGPDKWEDRLVRAHNHFKELV